MTLTLACSYALCHACDSTRCPCKCHQGFPNEWDDAQRWALLAVLWDYWDEPPDDEPDVLYDPTTWRRVAQQHRTDNEWDEARQRVWEQIQEEVRRG